MIIQRIVPNLSAGDISKARQFYGDILGLEIAMDLGWIVTFASTTQMTPQLSVAIEGGAGTPVPELSIEVDDLQEALSRIQAAGIAIEYGPVTEEWGVRRFYVRVRQTLEHTFAYLSRLSRSVDLTSADGKCPLSGASWPRHSG